MHIYKGLAVYSKYTDSTNVCPRSLDPIYLVTYHIKWVKISLTHSMPKKSGSILFSKSLYKMGQDFLDTQYVQEVLNTFYRVSYYTKWVKTCWALQ